MPCGHIGKVEELDQNVLAITYCDAIIMTDHIADVRWGGINVNS